jgi:hypothetical protein
MSPGLLDTTRLPLNHTQTVTVNEIGACGAESRRRLPFALLRPILKFAEAQAAEAIGGAIYALIHHQVKTRGPESMPELAPLATYMTLAPFVGAEEAYERAMEEPDKW